LNFHFPKISKIFPKFFKLTRKCQIPRALSEACRVFEDNVEKFNDFLKNQENNVDPAFQPFSFDDWKEKWKFTDSSRRVTGVAGGPDPWEGVPAVSFHHPPKCLVNNFFEGIQDGL
jgi:hypothetical protein